MYSVKKIYTYKILHIEGKNNITIFKESDGIHRKYTLFYTPISSKCERSLGLQRSPWRQNRGVNDLDSD